MAKPSKKGKPRKSGAGRTKKKASAKAPRTPILSPDDRWELDFRAAATADDCQQLSDHLQSLGCCSYDNTDAPERLLEGTIEAVKGLFFSNSNEDQYDEILKLQRYDLSLVVPTAYAWTFEWQGGSSYARIVRESELVMYEDRLCARYDLLDLAEFCDEMWDRIYISRTDWKKLTKKERSDLESDVLTDLRHDFDESSLEIWFDARQSRFLRVGLERR